MKSYEKLLLENKAWASEKVTEDPEYFNRLAHLQTPEFLWMTVEGRGSCQRQTELENSLNTFQNSA